MTAKEYDCRSCGACCSAPNEHREMGTTRWVEVRDDEPLLSAAKLVRRFVDANPVDGGIAQMRLDRDYTCVALRGTIGRSVECAIYATRPSPCHMFTAGAPWCLELRRERGID